MFKSSHSLRLSAEMRALERVARPWREARTGWFDGTPESIEARLAATDRVLTYARSGYTEAHMALEREAALARAELKEASHRLLVDFLDDGARAFKGSKRVAGSGWDDHPDYPRKDWQYEVGNGNSQLGYPDWVEQQKHYNDQPNTYEDRGPGGLADIDDDPSHPRADWQYEVGNNDTWQGYHDWVKGRQQDEGDEDWGHLASLRTADESTGFGMVNPAGQAEMAARAESELDPEMRGNYYDGPSGGDCRHCGERIEETRDGSYGHVLGQDPYTGDTTFYPEDHPAEPDYGDHHLGSRRTAAPMTSPGEGGASLSDLAPPVSSSSMSMSIPGALAKAVANGATTTGQESTPAFNPGPKVTASFDDFDDELMF